MNILVTGVAGFIGYSLSKELLKKGFNVYGIDNLNTYYDIDLKKNRLNLLKDNKLDFKKIDLSNFEDLKKYIDQTNFDIVIHLAAQAGIRYSLVNPKEYINSNIIGTFNLLENIKEKNIKHLIAASSSSVYGNIQNKIFSESLKVDEQISLYASTKKSLENLCFSYSHLYSMPTSILRFFTVYGPWGRPDMAIYKFTKKILNCEEIEVYNKGNIYRDFTYIDDVITAIYKLINFSPSENNRLSNDSMSKIAPYRVLNIGNGSEVDINKIIYILEKITGVDAKKKYLPIQKGDVNFTLSNNQLLEQLIDFKPSTPIEIGIKNFFDWYKDYYSN